ncbi:unnamed protein product [marine sediment metagenome]|uniref:Uncharacterized protein n=1 Tax=marine sediment metagenome TaxID=412755 RepID=X0YTS7_9ZZZZ
MASTNLLDYPEMGLPIDQLKAKTLECQWVEMVLVYAKVLPTMNMKEQARYADTVTRAKIADPTWVEEFLNKKERLVANVAFVAMYASSSNQRDHAASIWYNTMLKPFSDDEYLWNWVPRLLEISFPNPEKLWPIPRPKVIHFLGFRLLRLPNVKPILRYEDHGPPYWDLKCEKEFQEGGFVL